MATAAQVERMRSGYDEVERMVRRDFRRVWTGLRTATPAEARNALLALMPQLSDRYGDVGLAMAAEWFETITGNTAVMAPLTPTAAVEASVRYGAGGFWRDRREDAAAVIVASTLRHSLQPGRSSIARSATRHGMRYARSPHPGACSWCLVLSSRGAVYTADTVASVSVGAGAGRQPVGERFHDDCRCVPEAARSDADLSYDVEALYQRYSAAWSDGASDAEVAARMRELYGTP